MSDNLIRFFNLPLEKMKAPELKAEATVQKALRTTIKWQLGRLLKDEREKKPSTIRYDKIEFFETYVKELDGLIAEIDYYLDNKNPKRRSVQDSRIQYFKRRIESDIYGAGKFFDKEKFMLIARDRGYLSDTSILAAIAKELELDLPRAKTLMNTGTFTWGQVMCLGAMLRMNVREFSEVFLSGYFEEYYGEYIASYTNLEKRLMLKTGRDTLPKKADTASEQTENAD